MALNEKEYRPNELIKATVQIQNLSNKTLKIPALDVKSMPFYSVQKRVDHIYKASPIGSQKRAIDELRRFET